MRRFLWKLKSPAFKPLYSLAFLFCCILFLAHQVTQRVLDIPIAIADNYLDNILATPILLTLLLVERRILFRYGSDYTFNIQELILATLIVALVGEVLFPVLSQEFTSDWLDVLFYAVGTILFHATINKK